jgi:hypothetical protein
MLEKSVYGLGYVRGPSRRRDTRLNGFQFQRFPDKTSHLKLFLIQQPAKCRVRPRPGCDRASAPLAGLSKCRFVHHQPDAVSLPA